MTVAFRVKIMALLTALALCMPTSSLVAAEVVQRLGTLVIAPLSPDQQKSYLVPDSTYGLLVIESSLPRLTMRSNMPAVSEETGTPGVFMWNMAVGKHIVTVMADGFEALRLPVVFSGRGANQVRQFRVAEGVTPLWQADPPQALLKLPGGPSAGWIDGRPLWCDPGKSELLLQPALGEHHLRVVSPDGVWEQTIALHEGVRRLELNVTPDPARRLPMPPTDSTRIPVRSEPAGATILLNGAAVGQTPFFLHDLTAGHYELALLKKNFVPVTVGFDVDSLNAEGMRNPPPDWPVFPLIPRFGLLRIVSLPSGGQVFIDGILKGTTPLDSISLNPGQKTVRLEYPDHYTWLRTLRVEPDSTIALICSLRHHVGMVKLGSVPAGADLYLNGRLLGQTPYTDSLPTGDYRVRLRKSGFSDALLDLPVIVGQDFDLTLQMDQQTAALRLDTWPHDAQMTISGPSPELAAKTYRTQTGKIKLLSGQYVVRFTLPKHDVRQDTFWLSPGAFLDTLVDLRRQAGEVTIVITEGAGAEIRLSGDTDLDRTYPPSGKDLVIPEVPTGTYELIVRKKGFKTYRSTLTVENNSHVTVHPVLLR